MAKWIWHPGSFELYHGMLLHNRRTSARTYKDGDKADIRRVYFYPMWRIDSPSNNAILSKEATIEEEEAIEFYSNTDISCINVDGRSYPVNSKIKLGVGKHKVCVQGFKKDGFPAFYCKGKVFASDRSWIVEKSDDGVIRHAGESDLYTELSDNPEIFKFSYEKIYPASVEKIENGYLYDFGKEMYGRVSISCEKSCDELLVVPGESYEEATDYEYANCVDNLPFSSGNGITNTLAFRYIYIPNFEHRCDIFVNFEFLPLENRGSFRCDNELVNKIWDTSAYTMLLNSREGFFDGIKRDGWVWSGDAYQSYFVNYYLAFDKDIVRRTIRMLRGGNPISKHINTICDYTFYWICSVWEYYFHTGDIDFVKDIYPDMLDIWRFLEGRFDEKGMYERKPDDWVFIDWSTFDSNGPMCAEQLLLCRAYECLGKCASLIGDTQTEKKCLAQVEFMKKEINSLYWNDEAGAFVDDYKSGKNNVTRHANIFALLFDYTSEDRKKKIIDNVIHNDSIARITTPYFEFFELDAMCQIGSFDYVSDMLLSYWGGMIKLGATTIWEEFDPTKNGIEHYSMYGGKYEKSLCHAWGASPIYLLGKYALGVRPTSANYQTFEVKPNLMCFGEIEGKVPTSMGEIYVKATKNEVSVLSPIDGGTLVIGDKKYSIQKNIPLNVKI